MPPITTSPWLVTLSELGHLTSEFVWAHERVLQEPLRSTINQVPGQSAYLIMKGSLSVDTNAGSVVVGPGQWCLPHQGPRSLFMAPGGQILTVRFRLYWPGGDPLFNAPVAQVFAASQAPRLEKHTRILARIVARALPGAKVDLPWRKVDLLTHFRFQRAFDAWLYVYVDTMLRLGAVPSRLATTDMRVLKVVSWIDELPLDHTLTEAELLRESDLSASQLSRVFTQQFGVTPHQYFENRKLTQAKSLLRSTPKSVKQVAFEVGFGSLAAFSRWFLRKAGQSPREFRRNEQV